MILLIDNMYSGVAHPNSVCIEEGEIINYKKNFDEDNYLARHLFADCVQLNADATRLTFLWKQEGGWNSKHMFIIYLNASMLL